MTNSKWRRKSTLIALTFWAIVPMTHAAKAEKAAETSVATAKADRVQVIRDIPSDFLLPPSLWDKLLMNSSVKELTASVEGQEDELQGSSILFAPLKVQLIEKNPGVLQDPVIEYQFPKGGGQIDLKDVVTGKPGTFFVKFDLTEAQADSKFEAFHLSKARKRKFDNRVFGGGCKSYTRITAVLAASSYRKGIPVNTTRDLHVSSLGGHFILSWGNADSTSVTQVKFFDSTKPQYFCQFSSNADSNNETDEADLDADVKPRGGQ